MKPVPETLSIAIDDPLAVVSPAAETLSCNPAFLALAEAHRVEPDLLHLLGTPVLDALAEALRTGSSRVFLPSVTWAPTTRVFRVSARADESRTSIGVLLTDMTDEVAWRRQLFERNRELTVLNDIGRSLSATLDLEALAQRIHEQTGRIIRTSAFYIALHDAESNTLHFPIYIEDGVKRARASRPFSRGLTEYVITTGRPLVLSGDVMEQAARLGVTPHGRPVQSWLGVPLVAHGGNIGVMAVQDFERADSYGPHDVELLAIIAAQAAAAIHNAQLYEQSRRAYEEMSAAQARLLETERLRSITETVGALNHEVNNPLASIAGNAQLLMRHAQELAPDVRHKVESILEAARRIQRVTSKMASLIQATSMPYPGSATILDVTRSVARTDGAPAEDAGTDAAPPAAGPAAGAERPADPSEAA